MTIHPQRTAKARTKPSTPVRLLYDHGYIQGQTIDYGGGKGADFLWLRNHVQIHFFDPYYTFTGSSVIEKKNQYKLKCKFDTVICTYVLNVLPPIERQKAIAHIRRILKPDGKAYITVRADHREVFGTPCLDGVLTSRNTFQRSYTEDEVMSAFPSARLISKSNLHITFELKKQDISSK